MNFERMRGHFLSDSFAVVLSADLEVPRIRLDAQTRVLELIWWITMLGRSTGIPKSWIGTWYDGTSFERDTLIYMCRPSWSVDISGKINRNILVSALQLFRCMVRMVHYGRSTIACSQTLYFLFRDCRARVWKTNRGGFIDWKRKELVVGKRENRRKSISLFSRACSRATTTRRKWHTNLGVVKRRILQSTS